MINAEQFEAEQCAAARQPLAVNLTRNDLFFLIAACQAAAPKCPTPVQKNYARLMDELLRAAPFERETSKFLLAGWPWQIPA